MLKFLQTTITISKAFTNSSILSTYFYTTGRAIIFNETGNINEVLHLKEYSLTSPKSDEIEIKFLASNINPSDVNQIEGVYPILAKQVENLGSIPGNEGVAEVTKVGSNVKDLKIGDKVMPLSSGFGTWRSHVITDGNKVLKLPSKFTNVTIQQLASISVNPSTAYRLLKDYQNLSEGHYILQNGANSEVGKAIIILCKHWKIKSINLIRERENESETEALKQELHTLGADIVLTYSEFKKSKFKEHNIKLGFNCVGGKLVNDMLKQMGEKSSVITYGAMSKQPILLSSSYLIFHQINLTGFWMTKWYKENSLLERVNMYNKLLEIMGKDPLFSNQFENIHVNRLKLGSLKGLFDNGENKFKNKKQMFLF
ncbi:GroES-like protein [Neoconidiobolus thromboides FSU 785]|nr:GroES-like protein [Neoconidiobolus thromboides FSU 785]